MIANSIKRALITGTVVTSLLTVSALAFDVQGGYVETSSAVNFRSEASTSSDIIDKLYNETKVAVLSQEGDWYTVAYNGKTGYLHSDYIELADKMNIEFGGAKVTTSTLNLRSEPSTESDILDKLHEGDVAHIIGINTGWLKVEINGYTGYIHPDYVEVVAAPSGSYTAPPSSGGDYEAVGSAAAATDNTELRQDILDYAAEFLGVPYVYGANGPNSFDCSGFTKYVFGHFGIELERVSRYQYSSDVTKIKKSELQPGDLVFFSNGGGSTVGHVGIYVGDDMFIHASSPGDDVKYDSMSSGYYSKYYIGSGTVF